MITKGIVEQIVDNYTYKVRLPLYDGITSTPTFTSTDDLNIATVNCPPNCRYNLHIGDIVFVGFEDNDMGKPIILGFLYSDKSMNTSCDLTLNSLIVKVNTKLSDDTSIGEVSSQDIRNLVHTKGNIQQQIDLLSKRIKELEEKNG